MAAADLSDPEIQQAFNEIKGNSSQTNWICLGYVPKSDSKLKVAGQGSGGLKEFSDELSAGKILFGLLSFTINNTKKFVYVSWCGEGVIGIKKGLFNNHANDVSKYFKGFHVQINARSEDDLNEQKILERLKKATGASYDSGAKVQGNASSNLPTNVREGQKLATASNASVKTADKSDYKKDEESKQFWSQQREEQAAAKAAKATPNKTDYNKASESKQFWAQQKQQEEEDKAARAQQAKPKDFANTSERQQFWNQQKQEQSSSAPTRPAPVKTTSAAPGRPAPKAVAPPPPEPEPEQSWEEEPQQTYEEPQQSYEEPQQSYEEQQTYEEPQQSYEEPQQSYEEQSYDQQNYDQQNYDQQTYEEPQQSYEEQQTWDDSQQQQTGLGQVRALYDFDPENPDDLGFREGEIISLLDNSDPSGWWQGEVNGKIGFFPSNFVEIVQ